MDDRKRVNPKPETEMTPADGRPETCQPETGKPELIPADVRPETCQPETELTPADGRPNRKPN